MTTNFRKKLKSNLNESYLVKKYKELRSIRKLPKYFIRNDSGKTIKSIVFLSPSVRYAVGGIKVIYNQVAVINSLRTELTASVLHPRDEKFSCTWFDHAAIFKASLDFDPAHDFVMIPEIWAVPHARLLHKLGIRYGIHVQNGYVILDHNGAELDAAYRHAALILAISDDTAECVKLAFPDCADKIWRANFSVDAAKFSASENKENIICYMPRKLRKHSELVVAFLTKHIPAHWTIKSIDGVDENAVAAIFATSKIFLSFSEFEGCGLPPVEAALSGCQVIGYTGEGAKEYWDQEIFTEIHSGDIRSFVKSVLNKISEMDKAEFTCQAEAVKKLANKYSPKNELQDMKFLSDKVLDILRTV